MHFCEISFVFTLCGSQQLCLNIDIKVTEHTHTQPFNGPFSGTTRVSWYQQGKTNLDLTEARDSE